MKDVIEIPHGVEGGPGCVACNPRYARVKGGAIITSTHNKPPPRQEGEAGAISWSWQVRDGAVGGGRAGEHFN